MVRKKNRYCGIELFMVMEIDWKKAQQEGTIKAIDDWIKNWGGYWEIKDKHSELGGKHG